MKKRIAILGSTGSIGTQSLEVISQYPDKFEIEILTAFNNAELLISQAKKYSPNAVVIANDKKYLEVKEALSNLPIKVFVGEKSISDIIESENVDVIIAAMVGFSGLIPVVNAIKHNKTIALANKETLVVAGSLINEKLVNTKSSIIPIDSEHSAIFQCLCGEQKKSVEKIILTASGGPFRNFNVDELQHVTKTQALNHPNWTMGAKVTIDSATMMNKGLEVIEAHWLFNVTTNNIDVVIHPQSIIHSMVQFNDGSVKAQLGNPDMRIPIQYALTYPERYYNKTQRVDFVKLKNLTFEEPDLNKFPCLKIAYESLKTGGNVPCIMNAANEIAVNKFLNEEISFTQIPEIIIKTIQKVTFIKKPELSDLIDTDKESRKIASKF